MNNSTPVQETNSIPSHAIVDEHRVLSEKIDAASHVINIFFATSANQTRFDVNKIIALLEELRDIAQAHRARHCSVLARHRREFAKLADLSHQKI